MSVRNSTRPPSLCLQLCGSPGRLEVRELTKSLAEGETQAQRLHRCCAQVAGLFLISMLLRSETCSCLQHAGQAGIRTVPSPKWITAHSHHHSDEDAEESQPGLPEVEAVVVLED